ncbi:PAS domain-containing protein [Sphingomonas sp. NPDC085925]|jgi:PAS domain S-box-containing protein|uniref:PAS domain-containing protein n=2 Tax=Sphingomonas TaxID=13687 RepID=UPI003D04D4AE
MNAPPRFLDHEGEMAERIRTFDWANHPLGTPGTWPDALRFALDLALASTFPTAIYWGEDLHLLYNDAWAPIPAERHPAALGRPAREVWRDVWDVVGPQMARVIATGQGFAVYDQLLAMERAGRRQETWWNYSFTPLRDGAGRICGLINQGNETTRSVLAERARLAEAARLRDLFEQAPGAVALLHGPEHRFEFANAEYLALVGGRPVLGRTVAEALPELIDQGFVALLDRVHASGETFRADGVPVLFRHRADAPAETRFLDFVYQPVKDENGDTTDIFVVANDVSERAAAEEALRRSEERLQLALNASLGVGTWVWDVPADLVTADARFLRLYGVDEGLAGTGTPIAQFFVNVHPGDRARLEAGIARTLEERVPFNEEYRLIQPDGTLRWVSAQGRATFDEEGRPLRFPGVAFDVTERKLAEEAARDAAEELREANEAQAFLAALADHQRALDSADSVMRFTAAALGEQLGLDRVGFHRVQGEDVRFGPYWSSGALAPLEGTVAIDALGDNAQAYRSGRTVILHDVAREAPGLAHIAGAGVGVPLLRGGQWVAVMSINAAGPRRWSAEEVAFVEAVAETAWDAVERIEAVAALRESEAKFRAIANSIDQMVWSSLPDGYHDYYNDRWYEYTGVPLGSTDGEAWKDMFHPDDRARTWAVWHHSLETGTRYRIEYRLRHRSGRYRWVLGSAQPVRDERGGITRWFGTCTDIQDIVDAREVLARSREALETAVRERTEQLMAAEARLRQAQKMEAVGQLTGGIAHDFNNMLAVVIGGLDLLERRLKQGNRDIGKYITAARDGATRAAGLTQRLLAFSRQQPLAPVAIDANAMVGGMIELLVRTLGDDVTVETLLPAGVAPLLADPNQLENVILNLSVNARDAMPGGGRLVLATANARFDAAAAAGLELQPGDYVEIAVTDSGTGMTPEVAARAFDPFFTTKGVGKGTGLGLSQVFGFVRQSGGAVRIETAPGQGTSVHLYLPVHQGAAPAARSERAASAPAGGQPGEVVLVVEDEERVRNYSIEALRELGYEVLGARDGPEALRLIDRAPHISLLFSDVVMPELTGHELAARARAKLPGLRVLLTSGYAPETARVAGETILAKPFDLDRLATAVRAALDN